MTDPHRPARPSQEIPLDRLPEGFARRLDDPVAEPALPWPAATAVLLRGQGEKGLEVLLLRRIRTAGFVPGAYVFPGGRVDRADAEPRMLARLRGEAPADLDRRLGLVDSDPPGAAYLLAAIRETFEETGLLPGGSPDVEALAERAPVLRAGVLDGRIEFADALEELRAEIQVGPGRSAYIAHWVTPRAEPRRYDTRFFAFAVAPDLTVRPHSGEISEARWLAPGEALRLHGEGKLPMVFPTIRTLEALQEFEDPASVLDHYRASSIPRTEPRLVRTPTGVGIEVSDDPER